MALSPTTTMTVAQLEQLVATYKDIIAMINAGASNTAIAAKYGFYPANHQEAVAGLANVEMELKKKNGTWVNALPSSIQPPGCGVVGCWGKDEYGNKTLNGKPFINPPLTNYRAAQDGTTPVTSSYKKHLPFIAFTAAALLLVYFVFLKD